MTTLEKYARDSSFSLRDWQAAHELLERGGFSAAENRTVLRAAFKNRLSPYKFAVRALSLRAHVNLGAPI